MPREPAPPSSSPASLEQQQQLRRLEEALAEGKARQDAFLEAWVRRTGRMPTRKERKRWEKKWQHEARRAARRAERDARRADRDARNLQTRQPARGVVQLVIATACLLMALRLPQQLWWLVFVALAFFLQGVKYLSGPSRSPAPVHASPPVEAASSSDALPSRGTGASREASAPSAPLPSPSGPPASAHPRLARVDAVCDKLLAELRAAPEVLREVVHAPERTVQALREGCHELVRREDELRALVTPEEVRRLEVERERLAARQAAEADAVVRERLRGALEALDEQRRQRAELLTAAARLEAEYTRLAYTLENLYAQVLRVRSADTGSADVAGAGLRRSVEQLGAEVEAVTEALEEVHGGASPDGRVRTR